MAGIEKITNQIAADAEKDAADILDAAKAYAKKTYDAAEADNRTLSLSRREKADKEADEYAARIKSQCDQEEKIVMLKTKQDIIDGVLKKAYNYILELSDEEYFNKLLELLPGAVQKGEKGEMLLSSKDLSRLPADFKQKAEETAEKNGGEITLSKESVSIDAGFILRYGLIEINDSLQEIFDEEKENLQDIISHRLW